MPTCRRAFLALPGFFLAIVAAVALWAAPADSQDLTLEDAVRGLQILTRSAAGGESFFLDVDKDGRFGSEESLYVLQYLAGLRSQVPFSADWITVSGTVVNVSQPERPGVAGASVEVKADLDGDGTFAAEELFTAYTDDNGFFSVTLPFVVYVSRLTVHTRAPGYSEFIQEYVDVAASFTLEAEVEEGDFLEVDVSGIAAGPARAGRVTLASDEVVTLGLYQDRVTGRRSGRILGRFGDGSDVPAESPLVSVSFPLRGLRVPEGSERLYANLAYLDTVENPEVMPGSYLSEGEGDTPQDMLKTYGASMIELFDENGNELMTDPQDRSGQITIKIGVPQDAWVTLRDEVEQTADTVEVPLFYFDEEAGIWRLHTTETGDPSYGHLEDNFGNVLSAGDLALLQDVEIDTSGNFTTAYQPAGADAADLVIYNVGTVHHFSTLNSDKAGRTISYNGDVKDKNGNPVKAPIRYRKTRGGYGSDKTRYKDRGRKHVHSYRPDQIDNVVAGMLSKDKSVRDQWLRWIMKHENLDLIQEVTKGIRRYALEKRGEWSDEQNDLARGIQAIFSNKLLTDAVINTTDVDTNGLDCKAAPDLCKGIMAQAAEQVAKSSDAKKATAFLMQIAVDAYRPSNLNLSYVLDKGIDMMDVLVNAESIKGTNKLREIPALLNTAKSLRDDIKNIMAPFGGKPPSVTANYEEWKAYRDKVYELQDAMSSMKSWAKVLGERMSREALAREIARTAAAEPVPETQEELDDLEQKLLWDYEDLGGPLFGANKFERFKWSYYVDSDTAPAGIRSDGRPAARSYAVKQRVDVDPPDNLYGGGEIGVMEYFNGSAWVPLPGRSDQGVDASFIPVPQNVTSFGDGTPARPVIYLGTWVIDTQPNVSVSGRLVDDSGNPMLGATKLPVHIDDQILYPDDSGAIAGSVTLFEETATVTVGRHRQNYQVVDGALALGDIAIPDQVQFADPSTAAMEKNRNEVFAISEPASALSGATLHYNFKLTRGWYGHSPLLEVDNTTGALQVPGLDDPGSYSVLVTATADNLLSNGTKPYARKYIPIRIVNQPPSIQDILFSGTLAAGGSFTAQIQASDPDSIPEESDIAGEYLSVTCQDADGNAFWLGTRLGEDEQGAPLWTVNTNYSRLLWQPGTAIDCTARATVRDSAWGRAEMEKAVIIAQTHLPPEVRYNGLYDTYTVSSPLKLRPHSVRFDDINNDIVSYEIDCGKGDGPITGSAPLTGVDLDPADPGDQFYCQYDQPRIVDSQVAPYTFTYKAVDSMGQTAAVTSQVTYLGPVNVVMNYPAGLTVTASGALRPDGSTNDTAFDIVELPTGTDRTYTLNLSASTPNGDGSLASMTYNAYYEPAYASWWQRLASGDAGASGTGSVDVPIEKPGRYYVFAEVLDNSNMRAGFSKTFLVSSPFDYRLQVDDAPAQSAPAWFLTTDSIAFGYDMPPEDTPAGFEPGVAWSIRYDGDAAYTDAGTGSPLTLSLPEGTHRVRLSLNNTADATQPAVVKETDVTVYTPLDPVLTPDQTYPLVNGNVVAGDDFTVDLSLVLPDGVTLSQSYWRIYRTDGLPAEGTYTVIDTDDPMQKTYRFLSAGTYQLYTSVKDSRGLYGQAVLVVTVAAYPPVIDSLVADAPAGPPPLPVHLTAAAHDTNAATGAVVDYIWRVTGTVDLGSGQTQALDQTFIQNTANTAAPEQFDFTFDREGRYTVTLTVEDNSFKKSNPEAVNIAVAYVPPVVTSFTADATSGEAPLAVGLAVEANDNADAGTLLNYAWQVAASDGTVTDIGTSAAVNHTFADAGVYQVAVTVTDAQGLSTRRQMSIYVSAPGEELTFLFKQYFEDGLGPDYDFTASSDIHHGEGGGQFARIPDGSTLALTDAYLTEMSSAAMSGVFGFNGFHSNSWGDAYSYLARFTRTGQYTAGLSPFYLNDPLLLTFPADDVCGTVFTSWPQSFGTNEYNQLATPGRLEMTKTSDVQNRQGVVPVLGLFGKSAADGACQVYDYRFDQTDGSTLALDATRRISGKALALADGFALEYVRIHASGKTLSIHKNQVDSSLRKDPDGRPIIPYVPGADYMFEVTRNGSRYILKRSGEQMSQAADIPVDPSGVPAGTLTLRNLPAPGQLYVTYTGDGMTVTPPGVYPSSTGVAQSALPEGMVLDDFPFLAGSGEVRIQYNVDNMPALYRVLPAAEFTRDIDFATLVPEIAPFTASLSVDTAAKTVTMSHDSDAPLVLMVVNVGFAEWRTRMISLITDPDRKTATFSYPIPDVTALNWEGVEETTPGTDAIEHANLTVYAVNPKNGYDGALRRLFETLQHQDWMIDDFIHFDLVDRIRSAQATWTLP